MSLYEAVLDLINRAERLMGSLNPMVLFETPMAFKLLQIRG
jgi:hypothetical protein